MSKTIDYYFSLISPFTYFGGPRLVEIAGRHDAAIAYKPVRLARIFPASGGLPLAKRAPQRQAYRLIELARWRDHLGMPLILHPAHFPADETLAAKLVIAALRQGADAGALIQAILRAVWSEERDIADRETLRAVAGENGLDGATLLAAADDPSVAKDYEANTDEALDRQVFGAPSYYYRNEVFWGQDRLDFLERALATT